MGPVVSVEAAHPEYMKWLPRWRRCADFVEGEDAVKEAGTAYLPQLGGQDGSRYAAYKTRAGFFNGSGLAVQRILGTAFRRDPLVDKARFRVGRGTTVVEDVDLAGTPLVTFAEAMVREQVVKGRIGVLVDHSARAGRAFIARYSAESIVNWSTERLGGDTVLTLVVLADHPRRDSADGGFSVKERKRRRVLRLEVDGDTGARVYTVEVWEEGEREVPGTGTRWFIAEPKVRPVIRGRALDYIPFWFVGATDLSPDVEKPPLLDLVNVNHKHYLLSADHDHGLHWVSLPTPWVAFGAPAKQEDALYIGSETAWVLPPQSTVGMLEMTGAGLARQMERLRQLEHHMAALGSQVLVDKAGVEAADTVRRRAAEKDVTIADIIGTAELALNQALDLVLDWSNLPKATGGTLAITFNRAFAEALPSIDEVAEARAAFAAGDLAWNELVAVYKRAGLVEEDVDPEALRARIAQDLQARPRVVAAA